MRMRPSERVWFRIAFERVAPKAARPFYDQPPRTARGGVVHHLGIATESLEELVAHMKANGANIPNPVREHAKFKYVMVAAQDGLLVELFQCHEPARWEIPTQPSTSAGGFATQPTANSP